MKRIVVKHLSGSKVHHVEEFPLERFKELTIGRDPSSQIKYDPDRDDLVSRKHAVIVPDPADAEQFVITDLDTPNGTYVNDQRVAGTFKLRAGDVVRFGPAGPKFEFEIEPRPEGLRPTRVDPEADTVRGGASGPPTRVAAPEEPAAGRFSSSGPRPNVGRTTVLGMISDAQTRTRQTTMIAAGALAGIIVLLAGVGLYKYFDVDRKISEVSNKTTIVGGAVNEIQTGIELSQNQIARIVNDNSPTVVKIDFAWQLVNQRDGQQLFHLHIRNRQPVSRTKKTVNGKETEEVVWGNVIPDAPEKIPAFIQVGDKLEPKLVEQQSINGVDNEPISGEGSGSGFVVSPSGFIMTNKHVASPWRVPYVFKNSYGAVVDEKGTPLRALTEAEAEKLKWIPSKTLQKGFSIPGNYDGRMKLSVVFNHTKTINPARLVRWSDQHDVALIKIDAPDSLKTTALHDSYDTIQPGVPVVVLGYPGVTPKQYGISFSEAFFDRAEAQITEVANVTMAEGRVGSIHRSRIDPTGRTESLYAEIGDSYQLTINSTGEGNSGGPVFDNEGRVIGIFYAGDSKGGATVTYAVPIRFGKELINSTAPAN